MASPVFWAGVRKDTPVKLRKPWMIKLAAVLGSGVLRLWMSTVRSRAEACFEAAEPWNPNVTERFIYVLWHEGLFAVPTFRSVLPVTALISQSADGELISQICDLCGLATVRGSSSRGGLEAVDQLIEVGKTSHVLIAPDGPRGPRREVKRGLVYLAAWSQMRIVPLGIAFHRAWHAKSWDRTAVPMPFSKISLVSGPIIQVPANASKASMEHYRLLIQNSMLTATEVAETWAAGNDAKPQWPTPLASAAA